MPIHTQIMGRYEYMDILIPCLDVYDEDCKERRFLINEIRKTVEEVKELKNEKLESGN